MDEGLLSLKWNNHKTTFFHVLNNLRQQELYTDATLTCEGKFFAVHKLVLSTCSDYFSEVFQKTSCKSPVVILKDIKFKDLQCLLDYMYIGEVDVKQTELARLIKAAECLQIKGLAVPDEDPGSIPNKHALPDRHSPVAKKSRRNSASDKNYSQSNSSPTSANSFKSSSSHRKRDENTQSESSSLRQASELNNFFENTSKTLMTVDTIKLEAENLNGDEQTYIKEQNIRTVEMPKESQLKNCVPDGFAGNSDEIDKEEHDECYDQDDARPGPSGLHEENSIMLWNCDDTNDVIYGDETSQQQELSDSLGYNAADIQTSDSSKKRYICPYCEKISKTKQHHVVHIRLHTGEKPFQCRYCPLRFNQDNNMRRHMKVVHPTKCIYCKYCKFVSWNEPELKIHYTNKHPFGF